MMTMREGAGTLNMQNNGESVLQRNFEGVQGIIVHRVRTFYGRKVEIFCPSKRGRCENYFVFYKNLREKKFLKFNKWCVIFFVISH